MENTRKSDNYYYEDGEWWYCGAKSRREGERQRASTHHKKNNNRMWVDGKYIPTSHPLHKPGRYKTFEEAAFSSLAKYESSKEGQVYIITNPSFPDWVKVGMAVDANDRLKGYQTSSPYRDYSLYFKFSVKDRRSAEAACHETLGKVFIRKGEWFKCDPKAAHIKIQDKIKEYT